MSGMKQALIIFCLLIFTNLTAEEVKVSFTPPSGWHFAETKDLPKSVQVMVVGKGKNEFPPSVNLTTESFPGSTREYLKIIQAFNSSQGHPFKDLGTIETDAGTASLSQTIQKTEWGEVQMMHAILSENGNVFILTASSLKEEFPNHYNEFFTTLKSLKFLSES